MDTNTKSIETMEQDLLSAARALGELQFEVLRHDRKQKLLAEEKAECERLLAEAELERAVAEADYSALKVRHMTLVSKAKRDAAEIERAYWEAVQLCDQLRKCLWKIASSGDDQLILSTARAYGEQCGITWALGNARSASSQAELARVTEELRLAGEARKAAVDKHKRSKASVEKAEADLSNCFDTCPRRFGGFLPESTLIDLANALTGTTDKRYAYSFVYTQHLNIKLPEDGESEPL